MSRPRACRCAATTCCRSGVVVVDGDGIVLDRWSSLLAPRWRWWFRVGPTRLHGIRRRDVRACAAGRRACWRELAAAPGGRPVRRPQRAVRPRVPAQGGRPRHGWRCPSTDPLCTLRLSRRARSRAQLSHRLGDLCARYDIQLVRPHDALADADATAAVLPHLLRAHGIVTVDQLPVLPVPVALA